MVKIGRKSKYEENVVENQKYEGEYCKDENGRRDEKRK